MPPKSKALVAAAAAEGSKMQALEVFMAKMSKDKPGQVLRLNQSSDVTYEVASTGAMSLDLAIGAGGWPLGRIIECYGGASMGKTTLALSVAVNVQKKFKATGGGLIGFIDAEHALNLELCNNIGIDPDRFVIYQPSSGEDGVEMMREMLQSKAFDMIIVDSVAALTPQKMMEDDIAQQYMGLLARLMSRAMAVCAPLVQESGTMLVMLNQVRVDLGAYGTPNTTPGGKAVRFYSSLTIEVSAGSNKSKIEKDGEIIGVTVKATVRKNKVGAPFRVAEYDVIFGQGIEGSGSLLDVALKLGVVEQTGQTFVDMTTGEKIAVYKQNTKDAVSADPELAARISEACYRVMQGGSIIEGDGDFIQGVVISSTTAGIDDQPEALTGTTELTADAA
jgi:recombination protein RecA